VTVKAETSWTEGHGETTTTYTAKEEYMNLEINLVGSRKFTHTENFSYMTRPTTDY